MKRRAQPEIVKGSGVAVVAWQIVVPLDPTRKAPKSRVKIEFANVPSYESGPSVVSAAPGLVQIQDVILNAETPNEILADKAVALTARKVLKFRDVWDVWYLVNKLGATPNRALVLKKVAGRCLRTAPTLSRGPCCRRCRPSPVPDAPGRATP